MDESQQQFEKYYSEFSGQTEEWVKAKRYECSRYKGYEMGCGVQPYWMMWQASRAAIEIELPYRREPTSSGHYGEGYLVVSSEGSALDYEEVTESILAAGIKIKE